MNTLENITNTKYVLRITILMTCFLMLNSDIQGRTKKFRIRLEAYLPDLV
jgi:hypothetical protein